MVKIGYGLISVDLDREVDRLAAGWARSVFRPRKTSTTQKMAQSDMVKCASRGELAVPGMGEKSHARGNATV